MQQSLRRHAHLALVHTSIEHSRDWCRSLLILNCQELAAQQPLRPINWCSRLLKMTVAGWLLLTSG
ncbi:resolvase [Marinobacter fuscus]|uniref:Resolvase n=1 Tax=Marinobacter fuscus TaxID=2109942 RepID=A0A2T1KPZ7_9GAMM|nr:resolvase [Marinobacter fuscus]HBP5983462.1 resolvase [Pseudomonas aeruginosa]HBP6041867.1 resolvase [Pseudomonas aeruginosa]HBP6061897.1 resolvase [Pseudomonas aeruginosa]HBP6305975.1 resolvase [Pseudomonas aeruginosa]